MEGRAGEITPVPVLLDMGFIEFFFFNIVQFNIKH